MNLSKISSLGLKQIASICDHTFLMPPQAYKSTGHAVKARRDAFYDFMQKSIQLNPYAICVRAEDIKSAYKFLNDNGSKIKLAATVGFPDGSWHSTKYKIMQTQLALEQGADEIDMVLNYQNNFTEEEIFKDIQQIKKVIERQKLNGILKVIFQTSQLPQGKPNKTKKLKEYIDISSRANVQFIKTSTGFSKGGADIESVEIMRKYFSKGLKISGGVTIQNFQELLTAGSGRNDGLIDLNPQLIRIGESSLLK